MKLDTIHSQQHTRQIDASNYLSTSCVFASGVKANIKIRLLTACLEFWIILAEAELIENHWPTIYNKCELNPKLLEQTTPVTVNPSISRSRFYCDSVAPHSRRGTTIPYTSSWVFVSFSDDLVPLTGVTGLARSYWPRYIYRLTIQKFVLLPINKAQYLKSTLSAVCKRLWTLVVSVTLFNVSFVYLFTTFVCYSQ